MDILSDIITYVRRIIKSPSDTSITDNLIVDYINRFWINDVDARIQLFDLKTRYQFLTTPGVDRYNMPLYNIQQSIGSTPQGSISYYPVYQGFLPPAYINGIEVAFYTNRSNFFAIYPNVTQNLPQVATGNGTAGPYPIQIPLLSSPALPINPPINTLLAGHIDITGVIAASSGTIVDPPIATGGTFLQPAQLDLDVPVTSVFPAVYFSYIGSDGSNQIVCDSGQFLSVNQEYGLLMRPGPAPLGNKSLGDGGSNPNYYTTSLNTINYLTGLANIQFRNAVPSGAAINCQCYFFESGLPRSILFYNNEITLRAPPSQQYLVEMDAYLSPAAFLSTSQAIQFGYMSEYIARGAARKILSDTGDVEQLQFYEPLFREQEMLVWKRSQRQFTSTRTSTLYSTGPYQGQSGQNNFGSTSF